MSRHSPSPPATWLLERVVPERNREAVLGDLTEEYRLRAPSASPFAVSRWYWGQVCGTISHVLWTYVRGGEWLLTLGIAVGAYLAAGTIEFVGTVTIARLFALEAEAFIVVSLIVGLTTMVLGGYFAAWIRPAAAPAVAGIAFIVVAVLMMTMSDSEPFWYALAFLIVGPLASLAGGALCVTFHLKQPVH